MGKSVNPESAERKRREIAQVAARLFATQGYENTSVAQIAMEVGTSPASIFYYFPDKASLFSAPFEADLHVAEELIGRYRDSPDPLAAIICVVEALAAEAASPYAQGMLVESLRRMSHDPELIVMSERTTEVQRAGLAALARRAAEAGQIDPHLDPDFAARWLLAIIDACYLNAIPGHDPSPEVRRTALGYLAVPNAGVR